MTRDRFIEAVVPFGAVLEVVGANVADGAARSNVLRMIQFWFGDNGIGARMMVEHGNLQIFSIPNDNYPDLDFQWCDEGLLVCDLGPAGQRAQLLLQRLAAQRGWELRLLQAQSERKIPGADYRAKE